MERVLFARTGYMRYYAGPQKGDERPRHGGSFNESDIGHEVYNFKPAGGHVYGYFQPYEKPGHDVTINLGRIDPVAAKADKLDHVLIIFVSRSETRGQVIVGWYRNATVYRAYQTPARAMLREKYSYHMMALAKDAVLLPEKLRTHSVPKQKGAFGRANVVYSLGANGEPFDPRHQSWIQEAIDYVDAYDGASLVQSPEGNIEDKIAELAENEMTARSGQGFQVDARTRKQIEKFAVASARRHFCGLGYNVEYVGEKRSYDLHCTKGSDVLRVEVKGTQTDGASVILTPNEVANARRHRTALYILHDIRLVGSGRSQTPSGGEPMVLNPWDLDKVGTLAPLSYNYKLRRT